MSEHVEVTIDQSSTVTTIAPISATPALKSDSVAVRGSVKDAGRVHYGAGCMPF